MFGPAQAVEQLRRHPAGWWGVLLPPRITETREYQIIHRLHSFPVPAALLLL